MSITACFGISEMRESDEGKTDAIKRADMGLHIAKEAGHNTVVTQYEVSDDLQTQMFRSDLENDIKDVDDQYDGPDVIAA